MNFALHSNIESKYCIFDSEQSQERNSIETVSVKQRTRKLERSPRNHIATSPGRAAVYCRIGVFAFCIPRQWDFRRRPLKLGIDASCTEKERLAVSVFCMHSILSIIRERIEKKDDRDRE